MAAQIKLTAIHLYPVKSLSGLDLTHAKLDSFGLEHDRRWMVVDPEGRFLSQRSLPRMALIQVAVDDQGISLSAPGISPLRVSKPSERDPRVSVEVWRDRCEATPAGEPADAWLSQFLGVDCKLVHMADDVRRQVDQRYAKPEHHTSFADGFPLLLISEASLEELNSRLHEPVTMKRFRPNLVVTGCSPYEEDQWSSIKIGSMVLQLVKPCSRCAITTVDPLTGIRGREPLVTLARYRQRGNQVYFGQNLLHQHPGELRVGMPVEILESRDEQ